MAHDFSFLTVLLSCYWQKRYFLCLQMGGKSLGKEFRVMVFNATFNNISAILWRSVLLMEEIRRPRRKPPTFRKSPTGKVCLTNIRSCCKFSFMRKEHDIPHFTPRPRCEWHLEGAVPRSCETSRKWLTEDVGKRL
jgi:hypothetical protein